jgi:hypothetical protein
LRRSSGNDPYDWIDDQGRTYDAVGNFPTEHFDRQWDRFTYRIEQHLEKAQYVPVDVSQFTPEQRMRVRAFVADRQFGDRVFLVGDD